MTATSVNSMFVRKTRVESTPPGPADASSFSQKRFFAHRVGCSEFLEQP